MEYREQYRLQPTERSTSASTSTNIKYTATVSAQETDHLLPIWQSALALSRQSSDSLVRPASALPLNDAAKPHTAPFSVAS